MRWLRLDASTLKQQLVTLCNNWMSAFSGLLASLASRQLSGLHDELQAHVTGRHAAMPEVAALTGEGKALEGAQAAAGAEAESAAGAGAAEGERAAEGAEAEMDHHQQQQQPEQADAVAAPVLAEVAEVDTQQAVEELEALHGRLEGEREELAQRVAACQEQYDALVSLQVKGEVRDRACYLPATGRLQQHSLAQLRSLYSRCKPKADGHCWVHLCCSHCRRGCRRMSWSGWMHCPRCGPSLGQRWTQCLPGCVSCGPEGLNQAGQTPIVINCWHSCFDLLTCELMSLPMGQAAASTIAPRAGSAASAPPPAGPGDTVPPAAWRQSSCALPVPPGRWVQQPH